MIVKSMIIDEDVTGKSSGSRIYINSRYYDGQISFNEYT